MYCSLIYRVILNSEFIYPLWYILLNFPTNCCRTKSFPSHQLRRGSQPPESEPGQSLAFDDGTIDRTAKRKRYVGSRPCYLLSPASFMLPQGTTCWCGAHGSLSRYRQGTLQAAVEEVEERYFGTVLYSTVQYSTVRMSVEIRFIPLTPPPYPSHQSLSRRKIFEEELRCRIALRELIWPYQIRLPAAAQSSFARRPTCSRAK
jgi:hypothetical protein